MAPVDTGKLRARVDFVRGAVRRLERVRTGGRDAFLGDEVRPEELWRIVERHLADFDGFIRAIVGRYFPEIKVQHPTAEPEKPHP